MRSRFIDSDIHACEKSITKERNAATIFLLPWCSFCRRSHIRSDLVPLDRLFHALLSIGLYLSLTSSISFSLPHSLLCLSPLSLYLPLSPPLSFSNLSLLLSPSLPYPSPSPFLSPNLLATYM